MIVVAPNAADDQEQINTTASIKVMATSTTPMTSRITRTTTHNGVSQVIGMRCDVGPATATSDLKTAARCLRRKESQ